jgi:hypothetical protein
MDRHMAKISIVKLCLFFENYGKTRILGAMKNNSVCYISQYLFLTSKFNLQAFIALAEEKWQSKSGCALEVILSGSIF